MRPLPPERDTYLKGQVERDETVLAIGSPGLVTDRRILLAWRLNWPPHSGEWTHDAIGFDDVTAWAEGLQHDDRPILRIAHHPRVRLGWAPAHRFLWFRWGNRTAPIPYSQTELRFRARRDPLFVAVRSQLIRADAVQDDPFREQLSGTRQDRISSGHRYLRTELLGSRTLRSLVWRLRTIDQELHRGQIHWWIRLGSWALLAVPAWFVDPWMVLPAIVVVEIAWVVGLQWSWRRTLQRSRFQPSAIR